MCTYLPGREENCIPEDAEMRKSGIKPGSQIRPHCISLCSILRLKKKKKKKKKFLVTHLRLLSTICYNGNFNPSFPTPIPTQHLFYFWKFL